MSSSNLFWSELDKMKNCIYCVETANGGMKMWWIWYHLFILLLEENGSTKRVWKIQFVTRVCNHYPMLTLQFTGLRIYNGKSVIIKKWNIVRVKKTTVPRLEYWNTVNFFCWRETVSVLDIFSNNTKYINCN